MTGKIILVSLLIIFSDFVFSDSISEQNNNSQFLLKNEKDIPTAEELKSTFKNSSKINLWGYFWKILFMFFLLIGLIFTCSRYINVNQNLNQNSEFKILQQQYLSSKQKLLLVKSFNKFILLGITEQSINKITEFNKDEIDEENLIQSQSQSFFNTLLKSKNKNG